MPGWSRRKDTQWLYSNRLIDTLREYMTKFPELIEFLGRNTEGFKFKEGDIWPEPETRWVPMRQDVMRGLTWGYAFGAEEAGLFNVLGLPNLGGEQHPMATICPLLSPGPPTVGPRDQL